MDPTQLAFLLTSAKRDVFSDYLDNVANQGLLPYKAIFQSGNKRGESLWTHILNMVCVVEALQPILDLNDTERRVLFTAITVHDINKMRTEPKSFSRLAIEPVIRELIDDIGFDMFFPEWQKYLADIEALIRDHSGHYAVGGDSLIVKSDPTRLGRSRIDALVHLLRAIDVIDLSHSIAERKHKNAFLGHLNSYLNASGSPRQMEWHTHQLVEQRGILTNVVHNAILDALSARFSLVPVLLYSDGAAYLADQNGDIQPDAGWLGMRVNAQINAIVAGKPDELIDFKPNTGYKIKDEAFSLGVPFDRLWLAIRNQVSRRKFTPEAYDTTARKGAIKNIRRQQEKQPDFGADWLARLEDPAPVVHGRDEQFRVAELARAYRLFLDNHASPLIRDDPWHYVYKLLDLPQEQWDFYDRFNSASHRHLVLAGDITLSEDTAFERILADAEQLLSSTDFTSTSTSALWEEYVRLYMLVDGRPLRSDNWSEPLAHYVANQHRQCVYCSGPFATSEWMSADVRDGIKVQQFSYRMEGGGSREPKKNICDVCKTQFLLEKLNYPPVRNEKILYLHLFPYSFYPAPFTDALRNTLNQLRGSDFAVHALNMDTGDAVEGLAAGIGKPPVFRAKTQQDKPQPYGIYVPLFSETMSGHVIFPINAPGANDTERYLFAFWFAVVLQQHFGVRVLLSESAIPPFDADAMPDLFLDNIPLGCSGLLPRSDYRVFDGELRTPGMLQELWGTVERLFALDRLIFGEDVKLAVTRAMLSGPLSVFHTMDRLMQKHDRERAGREAFPHLKALAISIGGEWMARLSDQLTKIAELAWERRLLGKSLKRSSLLFPVDEVFTKLARLDATRDRETLIAATAQDIFAHLERIADEERKPGRTKYEAVERYVRLWYSNVLDEVYDGKVQRLLADEKLLRSAYLFFLQAQIPQRSHDTLEEEA